MRAVALPTTEIYQLDVFFHTSVMATTTCQSPSGECSNEERARTICPFCEKVFSRLGSHLPQCRMRNGEDYSCYLSRKTLNNRNKAAKKTCPQCRRKFVRLDTHLRNSATCRIPTCTLPSPMASPPSSQNDMTPPSLAEHQPAEISATNPSGTGSSCSPHHSSSCTVGGDSLAWRTLFHKKDR